MSNDFAYLDEEYSDWPRVTSVHGTGRFPIIVESLGRVEDDVAGGGTLWRAICSHCEEAVGNVVGWDGKATSYACPECLQRNTVPDGPGVTGTDE